MHNLATDRKRNAELLLAMNCKLNDLIEHELGRDDASYLHLEDMPGWGAAGPLVQ